MTEPMTPERLRKIRERVQGLIDDLQQLRAEQPDTADGQYAKCRLWEAEVGLHATRGSVTDLIDRLRAEGRGGES